MVLQKEHYLLSVYTGLLDRCTQVWEGSQFIESNSCFKDSQPTKKKKKLVTNFLLAKGLPTSNELTNFKLLHGVVSADFGRNDSHSVHVRYDTERGPAPNAAPSCQKEGATWCG